MEEGLGGKFWFKLIGLVILCGAAAMIVLLVINRAFYRWGAIGTIIFSFAILALIAWSFDRRKQKQWEDDNAADNA